MSVSRPGGVFLVCFLMSAFVLLFPPYPCFGAPRKNVLVIHNFNQDHPAIPRYDRGLFDVLRANERYDVRISSEYLNLAAGVRASDSVARWGGEEFLLVMPRTDAAAVRLLERIRGGIEARRYLFRDSTLSATATIGVATVRPGDTWDDVLRRCDAALYQGKAAGRNRVVSV